MNNRTSTTDYKIVYLYHAIRIRCPSLICRKQVATLYKEKRWVLIKEVNKNNQNRWKNHKHFTTNSTTRPQIPQSPLYQPPTNQSASQILHRSPSSVRLFLSTSIPPLSCDLLIFDYSGWMCFFANTLLQTPQTGIRGDQPIWRLTVLYNRIRSSRQAYQCMYMVGLVYARSCVTARKTETKKKRRGNSQPKIENRFSLLKH